jgi:hypothetical protein
MRAIISRGNLQLNMYSNLGAGNVCVGAAITTVSSVVQERFQLFKKKIHPNKI